MQPNQPALDAQQGQTSSNQSVAIAKRDNMIRSLCENKFTVTYVASPGTYENIYVNMPAFGLGKAGTVYPAVGRKQSAAARMTGREDAL